VLEVVAYKNFWILHWYFGLTSSLNDINILQRSHIFASFASKDAPACNYIVNGHDYIMVYYLTKDIYPS
jgi:hypothetical protein